MAEASLRWRELCRSPVLRCLHSSLQEEQSGQSSGRGREGTGRESESGGGARRSGAQLCQAGWQRVGQDRWPATASAHPWREMVRACARAQRQHSAACCSRGWWEKQGGRGREGGPLFGKLAAHSAQGRHSGHSFTARTRRCGVRAQRLFWLRSSQSSSQRCSSQQCSDSLCTGSGRNGESCCCSSCMCSSALLCALPREPAGGSQAAELLSEGLHHASQGRHHWPGALW